MNSNIKREVVNEIHKPVRINFPRRRVIVKGLNDLYQADLVEVIPYAKLNKGFKYLLVVINVFSKYVWVKPVKNKTGLDVTTAMDEILKKLAQTPKNLQTDLGKEFYNKDFKNLMLKYKINHYSTYSNLKSSIVERVNRTLKSMMWKEFSARGNYKWIDILQDIVSAYNSKKHSTTGFKPVDVNEKNEKLLLDTVFSNVKTIDPKPNKFKIGESVRVSKTRQVFTKSYTPNWSNEIFIISKVKATNPRTYHLRDSSGQDIKGGFYGFELQKVKHPNIYLVEKILSRKGSKLYVSWLGMDKRHNSWINKSDLQ